MPLNRRGFLGCLAGLVAAPMIVKIDALMPVKVMKPLWPEMSFSIERISVTAKSRVLKASYTMELAEDLKSIHGMDAEDYLAKIIQTEIDKEVYGNIIRNDYTLRQAQEYAAYKAGRPYLEDTMSQIRLSDDGLALEALRVLTRAS